MAYELKQGLKQSQQLVMSPQIQQAIKILTLGRLELEEFVVEELRENPCLEEMEAEDNGDKVSDVDEKLSELESLAPLLRERAQQQTSASSNEERSDSPIYELIQTENETLYESLTNQLQMMHITSEEYERVMVMLQYVDETGYFLGNLDEMAAEHDVDVKDLEDALKIIQRCEPAGVGARSVQECLLLQLDYEEEAHYPKGVREIIADHWALFEKQDYTKLARALKIQKEELSKAVEYIRSELDPKPARQFGESPHQIAIPDVFVFKRVDKWIVSLNEDGLPRIQVSKHYEDLLKSLGKTDAKTSEFVSTRLKNASWIVNAISERNRTILRVTEAILNKQMDFFEKGKESLKPLTLRQIADELGLHESTISRTTSNKYMHTPLGIYELKFFFNAGLSQNSGEEVANEVIRNWVGEYIKKEDKTSALSDQDIADLILKEKTLKVARRTVAKYREALGILPSSKRQKKI